jgi:hypothetical protein
MVVAVGGWKAAWAWNWASVLKALCAGVAGILHSANSGRSLIAAAAATVLLFGVYRCHAELQAAGSAMETFLDGCCQPPASLIGTSSIHRWSFAGQARSERWAPHASASTLQEPMHHGSCR